MKKTWEHSGGHPPEVGPGPRPPQAHLHTPPRTFPEEVNAQRSKKPPAGLRAQLPKLLTSAGYQPPALRAAHPRLVKQPKRTALPLGPHLCFNSFSVRLFHAELHISSLEDIVFVPEGTPRKTSTVSLCDVLPEASMTCLPRSLLRQQVTGHSNAGPEPAVPGTSPVPAAASSRCH